MTLLNGPFLRRQFRYHTTRTRLCNLAAGKLSPPGTSVHAVHCCVRSRMGCTSAATARPLRTPSRNVTLCPSRRLGRIAALQSLRRVSRAPWRFASKLEQKWVRAAQVRQIDAPGGSAERKLANEAFERPAVRRARKLKRHVDRRHDLGAPHSLEPKAHVVAYFGPILAAQLSKFECHRGRRAVVAVLNCAIRAAQSGTRL